MANHRQPPDLFTEFLGPEGQKFVDRCKIDEEAHKRQVAMRDLGCTVIQTQDEIKLSLINGGVDNV